MTDEYNEEDFDWSSASGADAAKNAKGASGGTFRRYDFFNLEDGKSINIRFLTDVAPVASNPVSWITTQQHNFVETKPAPKVNGEPQKNWPKSLTAVCRHDKVFATRYKDCYICDEMRKKDGKKYNATPRTWALAVRREEVFDGSEFLGLRDATKDLILVDEKGKPTGETEVVPDILIINMAYKNFFAPIQGMSGLWGTVLDRDLFITREGGGLDTSYAVAPRDPVDLEVGQRYDLRVPEIMQEFYPDLPDLRRIVAEKASDTWYKTYFIPDAGVSGGPAPVSNEISNERSERLKNRVMKRGAAPAQAASSGKAL